MSRLPFAPEDIRALADILADTGLTEIEIAEGETRIRVVRAPAVAPQLIAQAPAPLPIAAPVTGALEPEPDADHPGAITSPMVGVAYLSSEPGAPPFVAPGQPVVAGQTLLLIEAMKTFNQIKAPRNGTVSRILVASSQPVEFGEVLMVLD